MVKRQAAAAGLDHDLTAAKRVCSNADHLRSLSTLSDELTLRILSYLPVSDLTLCQRLSHKFSSLAGDGQLWKAHYYDRFVRPRASRLPGIRDVSSRDARFATKASRWLDEGHLLEGRGRAGVKTNWKRQYKLRHNWTRGSCAVEEIKVAEKAPIPPVVVQMCDGIIYMASKAEGLRAWSAKCERRLLAQASLESSSLSPPTCLAVDASEDTTKPSTVVLGFEDGSFALYNMDAHAQTITRCHSSEPSSNGLIASVAIAWPYVVTMTATQLLSVYRCGASESGIDPVRDDGAPRLLHALKSHNIWPPLSTCLRVTADTVLVSVAYALPTYLSGWTVGVQEIQLSKSGELQRSKTASAIDEHYRPLAFSSIPMTSHLSPHSSGTTTPAFQESRQIHSKPTSLSHTHPYLLVSHPDNTLTLYMIFSTKDSLSISDGTRLWGHTSSVSGAYVGNRGKAVSISRQGDELRVWELEGGFMSSAARKRLAGGSVSVRVQPGTKTSIPEDTSQAGLDLVSHGIAKGSSRGSSVDEVDEHDRSELTLTRGWIGFDEENVVVLKEESQGRQALVVYDFT
ncbi:hypothetical protein B0A48_18407 [Cryoendolithus antarcticus]|uniref:F-box domain-containing protein n=1 Tax=Cryoendolithus antarcticus TaxID=1507870 RepID=A0A1V8S9D3_9PEZI|nr:hypothetical protein B0A48_18407 [Cryoendolithus antarcticus]